MSDLPKIKPEELYKNLYEKLLLESSKYREQVTSLEILATKLREERDEQSALVAERDDLLKSLRDSEPVEGTLEPDVIIE